MGSRVLGSRGSHHAWTCSAQQGRLALNFKPWQQSASSGRHQKAGSTAPSVEHRRSQERRVQASARPTALEQVQHPAVSQASGAIVTGGHHDVSVQPLAPCRHFGRDTPLRKRAPCMSPAQADVRRPTRCAGAVIAFTRQSRCRSRSPLPDRCPIGSGQCRSERCLKPQPQRRSACFVQLLATSLFLPRSCEPPRQRGTRLVSRFRPRQRTTTWLLVHEGRCVDRNVARRGRAPAPVHWRRWRSHKTLRSCSRCPTAQTS